MTRSTVVLDSPIRSLYLGKLFKLQIIKQGEQYLVSDQTGRDGVDHVINIEQLAFFG